MPPLPLEHTPLSTSEKLILMKGSKIYDGHPFWPWDKDPAPTEFQQEHGGSGGSKAFRDDYDYGLSGLQSDILASWARSGGAEASEVAEAWPASLLAALDLVQDVTNDCSIVASLCVATARAAKVRALGVEKGANVFSRILHPFAAPSPNGKYIVRLQFNGCWRKVVIDDYLPVSANDQLMHVTARDDPSIIWPALIEKSLLKVMGGYDFPGSDSATDLWALAGWIPERISLSDNSVGPQDVWRRISTTFQYGDVMITLGTPKLSLLEENVYGLASGHDYAVIDMKEDGGGDGSDGVTEVRKLLIKNPWSRASDHLRAARRTSTIGLDVIPEDDEEADGDSVPNSPATVDLPGTRWMDMHDVFRRFETLYLSWNPDIVPHRRDVHFTYKLTDRGGFGTFINHPQFSLRSKQACTLWLLLCRHISPADPDPDPDKNGTAISNRLKETQGYISLSAFRGVETQVMLGDRAVRKTAYVNSENVLLRLDAEADTPYVVVVSEQDLPGDAANFTMTAFSTRPLTYLNRTPERYAHKTAVDGNWTMSSAGGNPNSPHHHLNPQFTLTVPRSATPADLALLLTTPKREYSVNVRLAWAKGKRIPAGMPARDVYVSSGEYRKASALAEVRNVQPETYTVVCSLFDTGYRAPFTLTLYSTIAGCGIKPAPADDAGMFRHVFAPVVFKPGVDRVLCPLKVSQTCRVRAKARHGGITNANNKASDSGDADKPKTGSSKDATTPSSSNGPTSNSTTDPSSKEAPKKAGPSQAEANKPSNSSRSKPSSRSKTSSSSSNSSSRPKQPSSSSASAAAVLEGRSPLRLALEYGQGPDTAVLATSGEPRSDHLASGAVALTTEPAEVLIQTKWCLPPSPGVWLVVERIGGAFVRGDELVYVEVLCSAHGFQAGQWGTERDAPVEEVERELAGLGVDG